MAGTALLPWEEWLARLVHPLYVGIRRLLHKRQWGRELRQSEAWPEAGGTVMSKK
jgi:hypothetical protein